MRVKKEEDRQRDAGDERERQGESEGVMGDIRRECRSNQGTL